MVTAHDGFLSKSFTAFLTLHSFSVTLFTLGLRLFYPVTNKLTLTDEVTVDNIDRLYLYDSLGVPVPRATQCR